VLVAHIQVLAFTSSSIYSKGKSQTLQWPTTLLILTSLRISAGKTGLAKANGFWHEISL
jgi:hypothetical protein